MKRQIQVRTRTPAPITPAPEHTPIYDMGAYLERQKQNKLARFRKNFIQTLTFCCAVLFVSPMLFMGG